MIPPNKESDPTKHTVVQAEKFAVAKSSTFQKILNFNPFLIPSFLHFKDVKSVLQSSKVVFFDNFSSRTLKSIQSIFTRSISPSSVSSVVSNAPITFNNVRVAPKELTSRSSTVYLRPLVEEFRETKNPKILKEIENKYDGNLLREDMGSEDWEILDCLITNTEKEDLKIRIAVDLISLGQLAPPDSKLRIQNIINSVDKRSVCNKLANKIRTNKSYETPNNNPGERILFEKIVSMAKNSELEDELNVLWLESCW